MSHVLVVDDDRPIRELLRVILELEGYEVATVEDGLTALEILSRAPAPWVVLMDVMMPYLSGVEVCRAMQARGASACQHQVALMTAGVLEENECPAPARALLRKPFDVDTALAVVAQLARDLEASTPTLPTAPAYDFALPAAS